MKLWDRWLCRSPGYLWYGPIVPRQRQVRDAFHTLHNPGASPGLVLGHPQDVLLHQHHVAGDVWYVAAQLRGHGHVTRFQGADINHTGNNGTFRSQEAAGGRFIPYTEI